MAAASDSEVLEDGNDSAPDGDEGLLGVHFWARGSVLLHTVVLLSIQLIPPSTAALRLDRVRSRLAHELVDEPALVDEPEPGWLRAEPASSREQAQKAAKTPTGSVLPSESCELTGSLTKQSIECVVGQHASELRDCSPRELRAHPESLARVAIKFVIGAGGVVQTAFASGLEPRNEQVQRCVLEAAQRWRFPVPEPGSFVFGTYRFVFSGSGK